MSKRANQADDDVGDQSQAQPTDQLITNVEPAAGCSNQNDLLLPKKKTKLADKLSNFFEYNHDEAGIKYAFCKLCKNKNLDVKIKMKDSNTSGVNKHLMTNHKKEYCDFFPDKKTASGRQSSLIDTLCKVRT